MEARTDTRWGTARLALAVLACGACLALVNHWRASPSQEEPPREELPKEEPPQEEARQGALPPSGLPHVPFLPPATNPYCETLVMKFKPYDGNYKQMKMKYKAHHSIIFSTVKYREGDSESFEYESLLYHRLSQQAWVQQVCEIGFNAGHSAFQWLVSSHTKLHSFDLGSHNYTRPMAKVIAEMFPGRFDITYGSSLKTVPESPLGGCCDVLIVDGGHLGDVPITDLRNMRRLANPVHNLVILDDAPSKADYGRSPTFAWLEAQSEGLLAHVGGCWRRGKQRGVQVGTYLTH